jgi:hypothetical protein
MRALIAIFLVAATSCVPSAGTPVDFIVADGFRGVIYLFPDAIDGAVIGKSNGAYRVIVPADGRLKVHSLRCLEAWHQETAHFAGGTHIPTETEPGLTSPLPTNVIALYSLGSYGINGTNFTAYFVGTKKDLDAVTRKHLENGL